MRIDSLEWLIDGVLIVAILVGFISVMICDGLGETWLSVNFTAEERWL